MNGAEIFLLGGAGYICGVSASTGFVMSFLMNFYVKDKAAWRMVAWCFHLAVNTVTATVVPIFLIGILVAADQPERMDFWPRAAIFIFGVLYGLGFILLAAHLVNRRIRSSRTVE